MSLILKLSMLGIGAITLFSVIMMIGNVLTKSPYARGWAWLGGSSLFLAALLLLLQMFAPLDTIGVVAEAQEQNQQAMSGDKAASPQGVKEAKPASQPAADTPSSGGKSVPKGGEDAELLFLSNVMEMLKQGQSLPPEYLAMLPDGGQGLAAMQGKATPVVSEEVSKPLQTQLVSLARSQGHNPFSNGSYVPKTTQAAKPASTAPATPKPSGGTAAPVTPKPKPQTPAQPAPQTPNPGPVTPAPVTPKPQQPQPQTPPPASTPVLFENGVLKSVLGKSKEGIKTYFRNNQSLGESANTARYLRGSNIVTVTFSGDKATSVELRFESFTPPGRNAAFYEDYMLGVAGMSKANASSRSGMDIAWNGVYPGASSVTFHIDTNANFGTIRANL